MRRVIILTGKDNSRTFSKHVEGNTGQPIVLKALTVAGECSATSDE